MRLTLAIISGLFFILFNGCTSDDHSMVITGKVLTEEGQPPALAHLHIMKAGQYFPTAEKTVQVAQDGSFSISVDSLFYFSLGVTAVDHQNILIPIYLDSIPQKIHVDIRLKHYDYLPDFENVQIIGDWNDFDFASASSMKKLADGRFMYTLHPQADTVAYQLMGLTRDGRSINGTMSDYYRYDGGGDYRSIVKTTGDSFTIIFDPSLVKRSKRETAQVRFGDNSAFLQQIYDISVLSDTERDKYRAAGLAYRAKHKTMKGFEYALDSLKNTLLHLGETAPPPVNKYAMVKLADFGRYMTRLDSAFYTEVINMVQTNDPLWVARPDVFYSVYLHLYGHKEVTEKIEQIIPQIKSRRLAGYLIAQLGMNEHYSGKKKKAEHYYRLLKEKYNDIPSLKWFIKELNPNKNIAVGKPVPQFSIRMMDSDKTFSNKDLSGVYTLIDFWAVWCGPCVGEMPSLHAAYKKFKGARFHILSLSFDREEDDVRKFRKEQWPMPWLHAFVKGGFNSELAKKFEVTGIPKPILVDPTGTVVAMEGELRGENLEKTLAKFLR